MADASPAWLREPERGTMFGVRIMFFLARHAPDWVVYPILWLVALYFTLLPNRAAREGTDAYYRALLGRPPRFSERHRQVRNFAHVIVDRVGLLADGTDRFRVMAQGHEPIEALHASGRGAVLLGAHFGSFEAMRAFDRDLPGLTVRYMMHEDNSEHTARLLQEVNPDLAGRVIPVRDGIQAMMAARAALEAGEFVAFLGDRLPRRTARGEIGATFLGRPVILPRAPYHCAMLAEAPILLCFSPRTARRTYEISFSELYDGRPVDRADRDATCARLAQGYADALGAMCRRHPHNWFNFFDVWR